MSNSLDLDDWLNSLGGASDTSNSPEESEAPDTTEEGHFHMPDGNVVNVPIIHESADNATIADDSSSSPQNLSEQDFDDILGDFGFTRPEDAQAEEIIEEEDEEWEEVDTTGTPNLEDYENSSQLSEAIESFQEAVEEHTENSSEGRDLDAEEDALLEMTHNDGTAREESPNEQQELSTNQEGPLLPLNSPTLLLDESTTRFSGAEWYNEIQKQSIIVAGIGGIGSNLVFQLARMHPAAIFMYDDDDVEMVNMAGQLYARNDIGKSKVSAMSDMIGAYTSMQTVYALKQRFESSTEAGNIMMCGFDNMEARKTFFNAWCNRLGNLTSEEKKKCLFMDGRLSIDTLQIFCFTGDDGYNILRYQDEYLFDDSQAEHTVCSMKQTTYLACMIGSLMTNLFTNFIANLLDPIIPYDLPFFTEYDAQNMIFKTIK